MVEADFVFMPGPSLESFGVGAKCIEDAAAFLEAVKAAIDFPWATLDKHFPEERGGFIFGG